MYNPLKSYDKVVIAFGLITLLFFVIILGFSFSVADHRENENRIREIQASRTESCIATYSAIGEAFRPLIPNFPENNGSRARITFFYEELERFKRGCVEQTTPTNG